MFLVLLLLGTGPAVAEVSVTYYHTDALGSTVAATDESGNVLWRENYRPYGQRREQQVNTDEHTLFYTGKEHDDRIGLTYFGARYYDPAVGRFMGMDPAGYNEGNVHSFNAYAYSNNNPYRYLDPDGESPIDIAFFIADVAKLATAIYSGNGIQAAAIDLAASTVGVVSPVPGTGQALKGLKAAKLFKAGKNATSGKKTYQTYTKTNPKTGQVYCGRTSGCSTPEQNIARRDAGHHINKEGFGPAMLDKSSSNSAAVRGREQKLIEAYGGAKSTGGVSGNKINSISPKNPKRSHYQNEANREFGK